MRAWFIAIIALAGLAGLFAVREVRLSSQIKSLQKEKEELTAQQQSSLERLDRIEQELAGQSHQNSGARSISQASGSGNAQVLQRLTALDNQMRVLQGRLSPEYDPTTSVPEPEPDTNAPPKRSWGPEQALGPPDTERESDAITAWTSLETDAGPEWLAVGFNQAVEVAQIRIRESYNAGAISKVSTTVNGAEVVLWEGNSAHGKAPRDFLVNTPAGITANSVIIHLDTTRVAGWNEIDAVELVGRDGSRQWASSANASSTYADRPGASPTIQFESFRLSR